MTGVVVYWQLPHKTVGMSANKVESSDQHGYIHGYELLFITEQPTPVN
jgi:hypothetical protein